MNILQSMAAGAAGSVILLALTDATHAPGIVTETLAPVKTDRGPVWTAATNGVVFGGLAWYGRNHSPAIAYTAIAALLVYGFSKGKVNVARNEEMTREATLAVPGDSL